MFNWGAVHHSSEIKLDWTEKKLHCTVQCTVYSTVQSVKYSAQHNVLNCTLRLVGETEFSMLFTLSNCQCYYKVQSSHVIVIFLY